MSKKVKEPIDLLLPMFAKAVNSGKFLDVTDLTDKGTKSKIYNMCSSNCRTPTKKYVDGLNIVSSNYRTYALAMDILSSKYTPSITNQYKAEFMKLHGATNYAHSPRNSGGKSPRSKSPRVKSPRVSSKILLPIHGNDIVPLSQYKSPRSPKTLNIGSSPLNSRLNTPKSPMNKNTFSGLPRQSMSPRLSMSTRQSLSPRQSNQVPRQSLSPTRQNNQFNSLSPNQQYGGLTQGNRLPLAQPNRLVQPLRK